MKTSAEKRHKDDRHEDKYFSHIKRMRWTRSPRNPVSEPGGANEANARVSRCAMTRQTGAGGKQALNASGTLERLTIVMDVKAHIEGLAKVHCTSTFNAIHSKSFLESPFFFW